MSEQASISSIDIIAQDIHRFSSVSPAEEKQENSDSGSEVKKVIEINPQLSSEVSTSSETKKITL